MLLPSTCWPVVWVVGSLASNGVAVEKALVLSGSRWLIRFRFGLSGLSGVSGVSGVDGGGTDS